MQYTFLLGIATAASAFGTPGRLSPTNSLMQTIPDKTLLHMTVWTPDGDLKYPTITAAGHTLFANYPEDSASETCKSSAREGAYTATLFLDNGTLNLYTPSDFSQQFQTRLRDGVLFFKTLPDEEDGSSDFLVDDWELVPSTGGSDLELKFRGFGFLECDVPSEEPPSDSSPHYLRLDTKPDMPSQGCRTVSVFVSEAKDQPNACTYCFEIACCKACPS